MRAIESTFFIFSLLTLLFSCKLAADTNPNKPAPASSKSAETSVEIKSPGEKKSFHLWLIKEMHEQIFLRPITNKIDLNGWSNVFSQGGSIEGVYHGLILSGEYKQMEQGKADLKALRFFVQEMALIENSEAKSGAKKAPISSEELVKEYLHTSIFTMKRLLGEKLLSEMDKRKNDREQLSKWYAALVIRWASLDVSFGMPQRNLKDENFHKNWAMENSIGLLQWEVLNRAHRILNNYNGMIIHQGGK